LVWVVIAIVAVAAIALVVGARKRRTAMLQDRFGPEYDRAVESRDGRRAAEADLRAREKQRAQFDVKPLPECPPRCARSDALERQLKEAPDTPCRPSPVHSASNWPTVARPAKAARPLRSPELARVGLLGASTARGQ